MKVHMLRPERVSRLGLLGKGWRGELPDSVAKLFLSTGSAERLEVTEARERPPQAVGIPSSASPAAPVSPQTIASASESGAKKRRRKNRAASS